MKRLPRRTFLKGVGLSMGLPVLEAMQPATRLAAAANPSHPTRAAFVFFPNGAIMPAWTPSGEGTDYKLSETLRPLEKFKQQFNVITGLAQDNGRAKGDGPGDHARCASTFLTGSHPYKTSGDNIKVGVSVDQSAAKSIGHLTKLPSLELGIEKGRNAGNCDSGYSCAYSSNVSWKTATTPMAKEIHPRLVFERLFGSDQGKAAGQAERNRDRKSILDLVARDAAVLQKRLGKTDRQKIDEYFDSVRELEKRVVRAELTNQQERPEFVTPESIPRDVRDHIRLMYDLMVLAFQTDSTRVATFMLGNAGSNRTYPMVGVNSGHHSLSHHRNEEENISKLKKIDKFLATEFAYFLGKLQSVREGEGTLLDHSMILYGSGLGDANRHDHSGLPVVMAGNANGTIQTGRHMKYKSEEPMNNLFLSVLDRLGAKVDKIGDSSGRLKALDA